MRAEDLFQRTAELLFGVIFVVVLARAVRRPVRANVDIALFFGTVAVIVGVSTIVRALGIAPPAWVGIVAASLLMALPYLLLRLLADFRPVSMLVIRVAEVGLGLSIAALVVTGASLPLVLTLVLVAYFVGLSLWASAGFVRGAQRSGGVTRRRLQAVAIGGGLLGLNILVAGLRSAVPTQNDLWGSVGPLLGMASAIAFFLGFAPPTWLRRAWQEPEVRAFLGRAATLPHLPDTRAIVGELERGAAMALGATGAAVGLWNESDQRLHFYQPTPGALRDRTLLSESEAPSTDAFVRVDGGWDIPGEANAVAARTMREQRALFSARLDHDDIANAPLNRAYRATAALAAPISAGEQRLGSLVVYAARAPIFAESDLELVQLLADQAAVILESRKLLDAAARAQAQAEAERIKEDFLSSAAHDLKTPLSGILTQAQVLQRRLERRPYDATDRVGLARIVNEARRLSALVLELLDVSTLERGGLIDTWESVDLIEMAAIACQQHGRDRLPCHVEGPEPVVGSFDPVRIRQLFDHVIGNAVKFSPDRGEVAVRVWRDGENARIEVVDQGIGIPIQDLPKLFTRFHRGDNVDDRRFVGLGLGLYISRGIAEQHGGRIWATSRQGSGTTVSISLPLNPSLAPDPAAIRSTNEVAASA